MFHTRINMTAVAATSFAGILLWLMQQQWVKDAIESIFKAIFSSLA